MPEKVINYDYPSVANGVQIYLYPSINTFNCCFLIAIELTIIQLKVDCTTKIKNCIIFIVYFLYNNKNIS